MNFSISDHFYISCIKYTQHAMYKSLDTQVIMLYSPLLNKITLNSASPPKYKDHLMYRFPWVPCRLISLHWISSKYFIVVYLIRKTSAITEPESSSLCIQKPTHWNICEPIRPVPYFIYLYETQTFLTRNLLSSKSTYRAYTVLPLDPNLSQRNPVHSHTLCSLKTAYSYSSI
jgi:hypothetical protein